MNDPIPYTFAEIYKDPAESRTVELELYNKCANFWRPNEQYAAAEYIRPNTSTGFAYQASAAATSGLREPRWPTVLGATVLDGSVTWTCTAAGANGLNAVTAPTVTSSPLGMTCAAVAVSESTKVLVTYSAGVLNQDYDAILACTINGVPRVFRQPVRIRYR